jgi:phage baseplate assembly protein W
VALDFLGVGWHFPPSLAEGEIELVAGSEDVREAVRLILETDPGERLMRRDYGCGLRSLVFDPITTATLAVVRHRVEQGLTTWEPRIDVDEVVVSPDETERGKLLVEIRYRVRATNTFYNLVYPFYLQEGRS